MNHYGHLLKFLQDNTSLHTIDKTTEFLILYASGKSVTVAAQASTVPVSTAKMWLRAAWFDRAFTIASQSVQSEQVRFFNDIIEKCGEGVLDRLEHGDVVKAAKGNARRKKISASDLTRIFSTFVDKRQLLNGDPTEITESKSQSDKIEDLKKKFDSMQSGTSSEATALEGGDPVSTEASSKTEPTTLN